ncbi:DUF871 domain-containing protein [Erysipelothrix sp. HDW6C]|uniref:DUF871 domain-containing protein n=1 Tax=Erysipelothrix sp. HDW6C TaxID=2714930 RepID=UPI00140E2502|nr:MupG family TIM beta-alpha barrel fold protein [Erysipelothrix sp. HDW6C]QIK69492.1 DUF871 domain-containing protein [Erysipelothrix sp. HDW6C]
MSNSIENYTPEELEQIVLKHVLGDAEIEKPTTRLGISIYPEHSTPQKDHAYLELAAKYGFTRMFTCLLSADESVETIIAEFTAINGYARELGFEVILDVNPIVLKKLGVTPDDLSLFARMNADSIRLDMGFGVESDTKMTYNPENLIIDFNASAHNGQLKKLIDNNANMKNVSACHNFYPQLNTGLGLENFYTYSRNMNNLGVRLAAFISSNEPNTFGPWPVSEGLVSVEVNRGQEISAQARFMVATKLVQDIMIGNAYASETELKAVGDVNLNKTVFKIVPEATLTAIETKILYDDIHLAREEGAYVKRDMISRFVNKKATIEPNCCPETLHYGDVIILNNRLAHYAGELQIVTAKTLNNDGRYNRVGTIVEDELMMIDLLSPNDLFGFTTT